MMMSIEERIAAIRAGHATQVQPVPIAKRFRLQQVEEQAEVAPAPSAEIVFDIANNAVAKLMARSDLSDKGKLEAVVELLSVKADNYQDASKVFADFEAYFTYQQSQRTKVSEQNIQRLTADLEGSTKSTIENILTAFSTVNHGVGNIKQLLTVMEKARIDGTTVEVLTSAYRLNETLLKEIAADRKILEEHRREETAAKAANAREIGDKTQRDDRFLNRLFDTFFTDDRSVRSVELSDWRLQIIRQKIESSAKTIEMKEQKRNRALEDGELAVLRTIDATEGGFTDQIVQTSRDSLALIRSTRASIEALLAANARSRAASADITNSIQDTAGGEAILKGALQVVAKGAHLDGQSLETDIERLAVEKTAAGGDDAQAALITVNMDKASKNAQEALSYEQTIKAKVVSFEMLASTHIQEEARAKQFAALVETHHELLVNLQQQALPITASALEMGLQQGVALRDGLLAAGVHDATTKAQKIFGENLDSATEAQGRLETEKLDQMRAAIAALGKAQLLISERTDKAIEHGLVSLELVETLRSSAEGFRTAMSDFQKVGALLTTPDTSESKPDGIAAKATPRPTVPDTTPAAEQ
jgi:hypothetical protein